MVILDHMKPVSFQEMVEKSMKLLNENFSKKCFSDHGKVWEKKDPSTSSKPKKVKKDEKSRTDQPIVSPAPTSSEGQPPVPPGQKSNPIIKTENLQTEPKIGNEPIVKIEQEPLPTPKIADNSQVSANFENDVDMSADPLDMSLNLISSSETFNFDVRAHQGLNLDTECSFNEFMPQGVATDSPVFIQSQHQGSAVPHQIPESHDVFDCNIKGEILRDDSCQPQTQMVFGISTQNLENQPKTGGNGIYQIENETKMAENGNLVVRKSGPVKSAIVQSPSGPSIMLQGNQNHQIQPRTISVPKIVQIEPQPSEEEIKAKKEKEKAAKKGCSEGSQDP